MKKRFFKFIKIDQDVIKDFCDKHEEMNKFIDFSAPFYVRVGVKLYPTLIHTIITEQDDPYELINFRLETLAKKLKNKITPKRINKLTSEGFVYLVGSDNANLIRAINQDIIDKKLNLKKLSKCSEQEIELGLAKYPKITKRIIDSFILFGCFKQKVFCKNEKEFINGLKIFLNKKQITEQDINKIYKEYADNLTLFSLCMFKINNERQGK